MSEPINENYGKQLLSLIKYVCFGGDYPVISDYKAVLKVALYNGVVNLFYLAIKGDENCPENVKIFAEKKYLANVQQQELQKYYAEELYKKLDEKGVNYLPIKGEYIRKAYKSEDMRTSCDVDFIYDAKKEDLLDQAFLELGFLKGDRGTHHVGYENAPVTFEAHFDFKSGVSTDGGNLFDKKFENYFLDNKAVSGNKYQFSDFENYLYFTMHNVKHLVAGGFGIRTVLDYAVLNTYYADNLSDFIEKSNEFGVKDLLIVVDNLVKYWFLNGEPNDVTLNFEKFILKSGTYGSNSNNASYLTAVKGNKKFIKVKYFLRKVFPTFETMAYKYAWVKKVPILLPIGYVVRWFEVLFCRPKQVKLVAKTASGLNKEEVLEVEKLIKSLNIK